jgi:hypothetical protein
MNSASREIHSLGPIRRTRKAAIRESAGKVVAAETICEPRVKKFPQRVKCRVPHFSPPLREVGTTAASSFGSSASFSTQERYKLHGTAHELKHHHAMGGEMIW